MVPVYLLRPSVAARLAGAALLLASLAGRAQAPASASSPPAGLSQPPATGSPPLAGRSQPPDLPRRHWQPSLYLDNRNPFEDAAAVRVIGLNVGVTPPGQHFRIGLGAYTLRHSYADYYTYAGKGKNRHVTSTLTPALTLRYFTPNFTYTVFHHRFVEVSVPLDLGIGGSHYTVTDEKGRLVMDVHDVFIPVEAGVSVLLKPTRWVGVSGGVGYRRALGDFDFEDDFNGWFYSYRLVLFVGPIWRDVRGLWQRHPAPPTPAAPAPSLPHEEAQP